jgi:hypothetical protein
MEFGGEYKRLIYSVKSNAAERVSIPKALNQSELSLYSVEPFEHSSRKIGAVGSAALFDYSLV